MLNYCPSNISNSRYICPMKGLYWLKHSKSKHLAKQFKRMNPGFLLLWTYIKHTLLLVSWDSKGKLEIQDFGSCREFCQKKKKMSQSLFCQCLSQTLSRFIIWPTTVSSWGCSAFPKNSLQSISDEHFRSYFGSFEKCRQICKFLTLVTGLGPISPNFKCWFCTFLVWF